MVDASKAKRPTRPPMRVNWDVWIPAPYPRGIWRWLSLRQSISGEPLGDGVVSRALDGLELPGRFELIYGDPPVIRDAAHNLDGAAALAEALKAELGERPVVACLAVLGDKDAASIVRALAPALSAVVVTEIPPERLEGAGRPGTSSVPMVELERLCGAAGLPAEGVLDPAEAVSRTLARAAQADGVALIAGSHYLLSY